MNILIILSHFDQSSLCSQFYLHTIEWLKNAGHKVKARNLYKLKFSPTVSAAELDDQLQGIAKSEDILKEQAYIRWADILIFIYPVWWWNYPAILQGWFERVFSEGFAFNKTSSGIQGLLEKKKALVIQTVGMPLACPPMDKSSYLIKKVIADGILGYCGIKKTHILSINGTYLLKIHDFKQRLNLLNSFLQNHIT
jgi:NAD(P)H dehydrogenase (quinone)